MKKYIKPEINDGEIEIEDVLMLLSRLWMPF